MDLNREFAELVGICWHDYGRIQYEDGAIEFLTCRKCKSVTPNPDYAADPRLVLREMVKRKDFGGDFGFQQIIGGPEYDKIDIDYLIDSNGELDTTGKLRNKAIEFLKEGRS